MFRCPFLRLLLISPKVLQESQKNLQLVGFKPIESGHISELHFSYILRTLHYYPVIKTMRRPFLWSFPWGFPPVLTHMQDAR